MKKNIQTVILIFFGLFIVLGVFVFAGFLPSPKSASEAQLKGNILVWGDIPQVIATTVIQQKITPLYPNLKVEYVQKDSAVFGNDVIEALASGKGPDLIVLPQEMIARFADKIEAVPPSVFTARQFSDTFIDNSAVFTQADGTILAIPVWTDPLVMYWNKSMFANANIARAPQYWDEMLTIAPLLTKKNENNEIQKSAIAFGEFRNVTNAKDILATLILQTGNPITKYTSLGLRATLDGLDKTFPPIDTSLRFYTDFADPLKPIYSWNRSLADSSDAFLSEDLATYFGYASELVGIRNKNPNLNFDVAFMPQVRGATYKMTFGRISAAAVLKASLQKQQAFFVAQLFSGADFSGELAKQLALPSPRRVLLTVQKDPFMQIFYQSALVERSWVDPNAEKTRDILQTSTEEILSGRGTVEDARTEAQAKFTALMGQPTTI